MADPAGSSEGGASRYKLVLEYVGTAYHGWQIQPGLPTVQGCLEEALCRLAGTAVDVMGAGRTDAGVHACGQVASFAAAIRLDEGALRRALNALLPRDIVVRSIGRAAPDFDARRSARAKRYRYTVLRRDHPSAWHGWHSLYAPFPLDGDAMAEATRAVVGTHDFSAFRAGTCTAKTTVRTMLAAGWRREGDFWHFEITGNAFLQHMVRILVGTCLEIGRGRRPPTAMAEILAAGDRRRAGKTAPPHGLCLVQVDY